MHILILLEFKAEHGGLHDNIYNTAVEAKKRGCTVTVACRKGEFTKRLSAAEINVIGIDYNKPEESIETINKNIKSTISLIHLHPGASRKLALQLNSKLEVPIIMTVHGAWTDGISGYIDRLSAVFTVSEGIKQKVIEEVPEAIHKIHVVPNYSQYNQINEFQNKRKSDKMVISLISRLDSDKKLVINKMKESIEMLNNINQRITLKVIGDGKLKNDFEQYLSSSIYNPNIKIIFEGWIKDKNQLKNEIMNSDIVIGPGRVAIDAYTLKKPVLVIGSQAYHGYITQENWLKFVGSNFGGLPQSNTKIDKGIQEDLSMLLKSRNLRLQTAILGHKAVDLFFNKEETDKKLFGMYEIICKQNNYIDDFGCEF